MLVAAPSILVLSFSLPASAGIVQSYSLGTGLNTSQLQIDFGSGNGYLFTVRWDAPMNGYQLLQFIDTELEPVSHSAQTFSFGVFVTGIGVGSDHDYGEGDQWPVENWWHYWVRDSGQWEQSSVGASDRTISNGSFDAWVFGSSAVPQSVPAPGALGLVLALAGTRSRRR